MIFFCFCFRNAKGGPGTSGIVLLIVTGRSWVRAAASLHLHIARVRLVANTLPQTPYSAGCSQHWVRPFLLECSFVVCRIGI